MTIVFERERERDMRTLLIAAILASAEGFRFAPSVAMPHDAPRRSLPMAQMNIFADFAGKFQEKIRKVTVQHILVPSQDEALEIWEALREEADLTPAAFGEVALARSTCGSAKKRPDAKMAQLRGNPGELTFRRGEMAPDFERVAFEAPVGEVQQPVKTQFGWHVMLVNDDGRR